MNIKEFAEKNQAAVSAALSREVSLNEKLKLNGIRSYALTVTESENDLSPNIYLEPFYEKFQIDNSLETAVDSIISTYRRDRLKEPVSMEWLQDFSQVRDKVFYFLINYEANRELLGQIPHSRYLDLAVVFGVRCSLEGIRPGSIILCHSHLGMWGITAKDLAAIAQENTPKICPVRLSNMADCIPGNGGIPSPGDTDPILEPLSHMYVLSNACGSYGAAALCYGNTLKGFSELMGADTLVLPESIHKAVLVPLKDSAGMEPYREMFRSINGGCHDPQGFLSNSIYLYKRDTGQIEIA